MLGWAYPGLLAEENHTTSKGGAECEEAFCAGRRGGPGIALLEGLAGAAAPYSDILASPTCLG